MARRRSAALVAVDSTLGFALAVIVAFLVYQAGLVGAGVLAGRDPITDMTGTTFTSAGSDLARGGGIALTLLVGLAMVGIYRGGLRYDATRLTALWVTLHCLRQGLLEMARVPFSEESDGALAVGALDVPGQFGWLLAVLGAAGLLGIGLLAAPALLRFAARRDLASAGGRMRFLLLIGIVPYVAGGVLALAFFVPLTGGTAMLLVSAGSFLVVTLIVAPEPREIEAGSGPFGFSWGTGLLLVAAVVVARLLLVRGVAW